MLMSQLDFSWWFNCGYWRENTTMNIVWYMIMAFARWLNRREFVQCHKMCLPDNLYAVLSHSVWKQQICLQVTASATSEIDTDYTDDSIVWNEAIFSHSLCNSLKGPNNKNTTKRTFIIKPISALWTKFPPPCITFINIWSVFTIPYRLPLLNWEIRSLRWLAREYMTVTKSFICMCWVCEILFFIRIPTEIIKTWRLGSHAHGKMEQSAIFLMPEMTLDANFVTPYPFSSSTVWHGWW